MNNAFSIGPLPLPYTLLLVFAAAALTLFVGRWVGKRNGVDAEGSLWNALLVGTVVARLAFVLEYKTLYFASPLSIIDIRDGGWNATAGLAGVWLYALHRYQKRPELRKALQRGLLVGTAVFFVGTGLLLIQPGTRGQALPDLQLASLAGPTVRLADFTGQPTVVNLWATWCPPCVREMPMLLAAQKEHAGVHFVFINQGEPGALVARWLQARQLSLNHVLLDEKREASRVQAAGLSDHAVFQCQWGDGGVQAGRVVSGDAGAESGAGAKVKSGAYIDLVSTLSALTRLLPAPLNRRCSCPSSTRKRPAGQSASDSSSQSSELTMRATAQ